MPTTKTENKQCTRTALLKAGIELMMRKGYSATGIQEILSVTGIPKGCFYHYFESKEQFALEVIRHLDGLYATQVLPALKNPDRTSIQRLADYCQMKKQLLDPAAGTCGSEARGCPITSLCQEMSDQSEVLRTELTTVFGKWRAALVECIGEGQSLGEIRKDAQPQELAELIASAWIGAVLRAKTLKSSEPMDIVLSVLIGKCLQ